MRGLRLGLPAGAWLAFAAIVAACGDESTLLAPAPYAVDAGSAGEVSNATGGRGAGGESEAGERGNDDGGSNGTRGGRGGRGGTDGSGGDSGADANGGRGGASASGGGPGSGGTSANGGTGTTGGTPASGGTFASGGTAGQGAEAGMGDEGGTGGSGEPPLEQIDICDRVVGPANVAFDLVRAYERTVIFDCRVYWVSSLYFEGDNRADFLQRLMNFTYALWACAGFPPPDEFALVYRDVPLSHADAATLIDAYVEASNAVLALSPDEIAGIREILGRLVRPLIDLSGGAKDFLNSQCESSGGAGGEGGTGGASGEGGTGTAGLGDVGGGGAG